MSSATARFELSLVLVVLLALVALPTTVLATPAGTPADSGTTAVDPALRTEPTSASTSTDGEDVGVRELSTVDPPGADARFASSVGHPTGLAPTTFDSDDDGLPDAAERRYQTDVDGPDSDADGTPDGSEVGEGIEPTAVDTDGDGLTDGAEVSVAGTDPIARDSDGDFLDDAEELSWGADPTDRLSSIPGTGILVGFVGLSSFLAGLVLGWSRSGRAFDAFRLVGNLFRGPAVGEDARRPDADRNRNDSTRSVDATRSSGVPDDVGIPDDGGVPDGRLIPDDVRVRELLERENGRVRQSAIVERTDWSKSKVSRLLSRMAEHSEVVKITLGRENLICLPGHEPAIARSRSDA